MPLDPRVLIVFAPHVLPVGGTLQAHVEVSPYVSVVAGGGASYDLPFSRRYHEWKFQVETGTDLYLHPRPTPLTGWLVSARALVVWWDDIPHIGGDHVGGKAMVGYRFGGRHWTVGGALGLVARAYWGEIGPGYVLYHGEFLLPTAELTVGTAFAVRHRKKPTDGGVGP